MKKTDILPLTAVALGLAVHAPAGAQTDFRSATDNVLLQLGVEPEAAPETDTAETSAEQFGSDLKELVDRAKGEGKSDDYINAIVLEAANKGELEVPGAMRDSDGQVDPEAMIASIVRVATAPEGDEGYVAAITAESSAAETLVETTYVVQSGDSLGRIAQQFYGDPLRYEEIFAANRDTVTSADRIFIGQVLKIPNVSPDA